MPIRHYADDICHGFFADAPLLIIDADAISHTLTLPLCPTPYISDAVFRCRCAAAFIAILRR